MIQSLPVLHAGGNSNNGANDGRFYGNWNNTASNSNWNISGLPFFRFKGNIESSIKEPVPLDKIKPPERVRARPSRFILERARGERRTVLPKRIGHLYELVISEENCIAATIEMTKGKNHNKKAMRIRKNAEDYGRRLAKELAEGRWVARPYNEHVIEDGVRKKKRNIKVPCLHDQAVHHAVMRVMIPHIIKRNYFYNCGSIPKAGQMRAIRAMKKWMGVKRPPKYCGQFDIKKFYESCPHWAVMNALRRIFKDKRFLHINEMILDSMGNGLAIGFYPAQWYANIVLMVLDNDIVQHVLPGCHYVRYMDDICILHNNKRKLRRAKIELERMFGDLGLTLNPKWQIKKIGKEGITFLSYRFFKGYTMMKKSLMYRITRKIKKTARNPSLHNCRAITSYIGILKHCNSHNYKMQRLYPTLSIKYAKGVISHASRIRNNAPILQN